jgi:hypothetical protein
VSAEPAGNTDPMDPAAATEPQGRALPPRGLVRSDIPRTAEPPRARASGGVPGLDVALEIHAEVGGEWTMQRHLVDRIASGRRSAERKVALLLRPGRVVAWSLVVAPVVVAAIAAFTDAGYLARLSAQWLLPLASGLLAAGGVWWSHQLARPPFTVRPAARRVYARHAETAARLEPVLERGALYAAADLPVDEALRRAARDDPDGPGCLLVRRIANRSVDGPGRENATPVDRCARHLRRWLDQYAAPEEALAAGAARLRIEEAWLTWPGLPRLLARMTAPLLLCTLPAALLVARL